MGGKQRARCRAVPPLLRRKQLPASRATSIAHRMVTDLTRPGLLAWFSRTAPERNPPPFRTPSHHPEALLSGAYAATSLHRRLVWDALYTSNGRQVKCQNVRRNFKKNQTATETLFFQDFGHCIFRVSRLLQKIDNKGVMFFLCTSHALGLHFVAVKLYNACNPNH